MGSDTKGAKTLLSYTGLCRKRPSFFFAQQSFNFHLRCCQGLNGNCFSRFSRKLGSSEFAIPRNARFYFRLILPVSCISVHPNDRNAARTSPNWAKMFISYYFIILACYRMFDDYLFFLLSSASPDAIFGAQSWKTSIESIR